MVTDPLVVWMALKIFGIVVAILVAGTNVYEYVHLRDNLQSRELGLKRVVRGLRNQRRSLGKVLRDFDRVFFRLVRISGPTIRCSLQTLSEPLKVLEGENLIRQLNNPETRGRMADTLTVYQQAIEDKDEDLLSAAITEFARIVLEHEIAEDSAQAEIGKELVEDMRRCVTYVENYDPGQAMALINKWDAAKLRQLPLDLLVPALIVRGWIRNIYYDPTMAAITGTAEEIKSHYKSRAVTMKQLIAILDSPRKSNTAIWGCLTERIDA